MQQTITVIIADDNRHMRESLKVLLASYDHIDVIGEALNGEETIKLCTEKNPAVVLLDINMSPVNGFEAARKILKQNPSIRIIALSMHKEPSYCRNMMRIGAKGYVAKSSSYGEILEAINEVSAGRKYIDKSIK
jgi:two-component system invasion response regulator UvrY